MRAYFVFWLITASLFSAMGKSASSEGGLVTPQQPEAINLLDLPRFWQKPQLLSEIRQKRRILSSVTREGGIWNFRGAGVVAVPASFAETEARNFSRLQKMPDYFPKVEFIANQSLLRLRLRFLTKEFDCAFEIQREEGAHETHLFFRQREGCLEGSEAVLIFRSLSRQETEVGLFARAREKPLWVPDLIFRVTAEAVMHHVALSLRKTLEKDYKN